MRMEHRMKSTVTKIFHTSLKSCIEKGLLDVAETSALSGKLERQSSLPPRSNACSFLNDDVFSGRCYRTMKGKKRRNKTGRTRRAPALSRSFSMDSVYYYSWFSSEDEDDDNEEEEAETESLFLSSRSNTNTASSDSSRIKSHRRRSIPASNDDDVGKQIPLRDCCPRVRPAIRDSFAVVKTSIDPYNDFRTSMVEMIFEKQIFRAKELQNLLLCFLSLNSENLHVTIIEIFTEICEALFC